MIVHMCKLQMVTLDEQFDRLIVGLQHLGYLHLEPVPLSDPQAAGVLHRMQLTEADHQRRQVLAEARRNLEALRAALGELPAPHAVEAAPTKMGTGTDRPDRSQSHFRAAEEIRDAAAELLGRAARTATPAAKPGTGRAHPAAVSARRPPRPAHRLRHGRIPRAAVYFSQCGADRRQDAPRAAENHGAAAPAAVLSGDGRQQRGRRRLPRRQCGRRPSGCLAGRDAGIQAAVGLPQRTFGRQHSPRANRRGRVARTAGGVGPRPGPLSPSGGALRGRPGPAMRRGGPAAGGHEQFHPRGPLARAPCFSAGGQEGRSGARGERIDRRPGGDRRAVRRPAFGGRAGRAAQPGLCQTLRGAAADLPAADLRNLRSDAGQRRRRPVLLWSDRRRRGLRCDHPGGGPLAALAVPSAGGAPRRGHDRRLLRGERDALRAAVRRAVWVAGRAAGAAPADPPRTAGRSALAAQDRGGHRRDARRTGALFGHAHGAPGAGPPRLPRAAGAAAVFGERGVADGRSVPDGCLVAGRIRDLPGHRSRRVAVGRGRRRVAGGVQPGQQHPVLLASDGAGRCLGGSGAGGQPDLCQAGLRDHGAVGGCDAARA